MMRIINRWVALLVAISFWAAPLFSAQAQETSFPRPLDSYGNVPGQTLVETLSQRISQEPFNLVATIIFVLAIIHTFLAPFFTRLAHSCEKRHRQRIEQEGRTAEAKALINAKDDVSFRAEILHFFGEVEAIFGIWVIPLLVIWVIFKGWSSAKHYVDGGVNFTEPVFVVVIMAMSASRPVLKLAETLMAGVASLGRGTPAAWWFSILTLGPLLGSLITEPAAMTISALLLARKFFDRKPSPAFAYATLGLLFVNVSVGGTLTHFAAPPVLMVSSKWNWGTPYMLAHFGWKAVMGIITANLIYLVWFRGEFRKLAAVKSEATNGVTLWEHRPDPVPLWVTVITVIFLGWTVMNSHYPVLFIGGFLFYLAFAQATEHHQNDINLRSPLLVGFFLSGLVIHGGLQGWWLGPVLRSLSEVPLFLGATALTAFNDNAAITYLATLVPVSPELKYSVVAGAVTGGGLTVIANAPNPAGQSILSKYFPDGVSPLKLFSGALLPTIIVAAYFLALRRFS